MKIKDYKCKCGHNDFFFADKGNQKGIYCTYCGKWNKWADKNEQNLAMKQEPMLDKIRAEIVELTRCPYGTECLGANCPSNTDCMLCGDHVLEIIDKYKSESEVSNGRYRISN